MPEISIIVPVYKVEHYLCECVDSLLSQTFSNIEIILVDDGSPDCCGAICDHYAQQDMRVRVIHQENAGVSAARNKGIESAKGRYICFVDSDDVLDQEYCRVLYNLLDDTDYDFSTCATLRFRDGEKHSVPKQKGHVQYLSNEQYLRYQLEKKSEIGPWNKLFRKKALERIRFKENQRYEDVTFSADLALYLRNGVICTERILYYYRQQDSGFMATQAVKRMADFIHAGEYMIEVAKTVCPELLHSCLNYAAVYPFMFVDGIYVHRTFGKNKAFLSALQSLLRRYSKEYATLEMVSPIIRRRMRLFATSRALYGLNAYARLFRVYLYRIIGKDAYADGHGI